MLALLVPAGLLALLALALPALIHLARRSEEQRTDFAALRWLSEKPKPRQRLRFDELPLLLLRLLLLALVALWLARPALRDTRDATPWIVAVPGVEAPPPTDGAEVRWLAPGFPPIDADVPTASVTVASLLRELDAQLPAAAPLTVLLPERLSGLDGERLRLSRRVDWQVRPGTMPAPRPAAAAAPILAVRFAPDQAGGLRYLRAAAAAWRQPGQAIGYRAAGLTAPLPATGEVLVWLAPGTLPASVTDWIRRGGTALVGAGTQLEGSDGSEGPLATERSLGRGRLVRLTRPLTPAAMPELLEPDFPRRLRELLAPAPAAPSAARATDVAPLGGGARYRQSARELQPWLALLIAALLLIERWAATRRARRVAP
jgi:hypothetical protein